MFNQGTAQIHNTSEGGTPVNILLEAVTEILHSSFRGKRSPKTSSESAKVLSLHFQFRARDGGEKCITWFTPLLILWCLRSQKALKAFICSSHTENLQTMTFSVRNEFIQCNGIAFIIWASFLNCSLLLTLTQLPSSSYSWGQLECFQNNRLKSKTTSKAAQSPNAPELISNITWEWFFLHVGNVLWLQREANTVLQTWPS